MPLKLVSALAVVAALIPAGTALADTVARPLASTAVREYEGTVVYSQFEPATQQYRLAIRRAGTTVPELLPVAPSDRSFDADIGLGSAGPQLVYTRCSETCDLFTYSLGGGPQGERAIRNANDPEHHDVQPTIWRGRIAWARIYGEQIDRKVIVYTKSLTAPRSQPSARLPGVPERGGATTGHAVDALELWGENLAQVVSYQCRDCPGTSQVELRLVRVSARTARPVSFQTVGLSGQWIAGPSFANGWLGWYRTCLGDGEACRAQGGGTPYRHHLGSRRYAKGAPGPVRVSGFADTGAWNWRVENCSPETNDPSFNADCRLEQAPAPAYEPDTASRHRRP